MYMVKRVFATLLILQHIRHPSLLGAENEHRKRPVSYRCWSIFRYLYQLGGLSMLLKGMEVGLVYTITYSLFTSIATVISTNTLWYLVSHLAIAVLLSGLHLSWTQAVISRQSLGMTFIRKPPSALVIPTIAHTGAQILMTEMPTFFGSSILANDSYENSSAQKMALRDLVAVFVALTIRICFVLPTSATLCCVEAGFSENVISIMVPKQKGLYPARGENPYRALHDGLGYRKLLGLTAKFTTTRLIYLHVEMSLALLCLESLGALLFHAVLQCY